MKRDHDNRPKEENTPDTATREPQTSTSISRREALERLAKLSAYSAPTVTTLLSVQLSYAQTSEALNVTNPVAMAIVNACQQGFRSDLGERFFNGESLGNNSGWSFFGATDDPSDCMN